MMLSLEQLDFLRRPSSLLVSAYVCVIVIDFRSSVLYSIWVIDGFDIFFTVLVDSSEDHFMSSHLFSALLDVYKSYF